METYDIHIRTPIFHPKARYGWPEEELGIGISIKRMNQRSQFITIKVGKDEKNLYVVDKNKVVEFTDRFKNSFDECKGVKLVIIPVGGWGKSMKLYKKIKVENKHDKLSK